LALIVLFFIGLLGVAIIDEGVKKKYSRDEYFTQKEKIEKVEK